MLLADMNQLLVITEHRVGIILLGFDAEGLVLVVHAEPGLGSRGGEAAVRSVVPGHGCTGIIAAFQSDDVHCVGHVWFFGRVFVFP